MNTDLEAASTIGTAFFGFACVFAFFIIRKPEERNFLLPLGLAAFTLKAILVPIYFIALVATGLDGYAYIDSYEYHLDGIEVARELQRGIDYRSRAWGTVDPGYPLFTGVVYWIVGINTLAVRMLNAVFSTMMLLYVYRMARLVFEEDRRIARWACYLVAFLPYSIMIVVNHRKEAIVTLLAVFISYHAMRFLRFRQDSLRGGLFALLGLGVMSFFRSGFVLPFVGILFICYILTQRSLLQAVALSIPTAVGLIVVQLLLGDDASISLSASSQRLQGKLADSAGLASTGGLVRFARITSIFEIYKLPLSSVLVTILPFPPYWRGHLPMVLLSWLNLFNLAFLPFMISGSWVTISGERWRERVPLLLIPVIFLVLIGAAHVGVVRYRETVFPMMLIVASAGMARGNNAIVVICTYSALLALGALVWVVRYT